MDNFPDYVFFKDYDLLPLSRLKKFISENGRLPKMPTAEAAKKEGVEIAELTRIQTEKIEELTLYIIELHERIEKLESQIKNEGN